MVKHQIFLPILYAYYTVYVTLYFRLKRKRTEFNLELIIIININPKRKVGKQDMAVVDGGMGVIRDWTLAFLCN